MFDEYKEHDVAVYGGFLEEDSMIMQSTSGGIATALSEYMLEQGGYVAGVAYSKDFHKAEYILIHDKSEIQRLKGSKYIDCDKKNIYSDVKSLLEAGEKVLFIGLPCIVAALYKYIGARPENLLTCELICHGPTISKVHRDYVLHLEDTYKSKLIAFSVRHKKDAWTPLYLYAKFENGNVFEKKFYETEYGYAFSVLSRESCYCCKFKGNNRQGDIMVGDFWGATDRDPYWNKHGVSSVFAETNKGNEFLKSTPGIKLFPTTFEKVVKHNPMVIKARYRKRDHKKFEKLLAENDLFYAVKHGVSFKTKVKRLIIQMIPRSMKPMMKKAYRSFKGK